MSHQKIVHRCVQVNAGEDHLQVERVEVQQGGQDALDQHVLDAEAVHPPRDEGCCRQTPHHICHWGLVVDRLLLIYLDVSGFVAGLQFCIP